MQRDIRAVVFDMDGLMLDTEPLYKASWQTASLELGHEIDDAFYATFVGRPNPDCERDLVQRFGSRFPLDRFRERWPELWRADADANGIRLKPGLLELLALLETERVRCAVATSSEAPETAFSLRAAGLEGRFPVIVTSDQVARGKPAPDLYLEAARRLYLAPDQCVALEDSEAGIQAARRARMVPILVPDGSAPSPAAADAAFQVLPSLREAREVVRLLLRTPS
jgi:HAD superfamily hydrolase (TIGR01509 family)